MSEARGVSEGHGANTSNEKTAADDEEKPISMDLLPFQQDIVEELLNSDGLAVMGKGLGLCTVAAALLLVHHATEQSGGVVIILGVMPLHDIFSSLLFAAACLGPFDTRPQAAPTGAAWTGPRMCPAKQQAPNLYRSLTIAERPD